MSDDKIYYLASPYSHSDRAVRVMRYNLACEAVNVLQGFGYTVFSPIVHSHHISELTCNNDLDYWLDIDFKFIRKLDGLMVLVIDGTTESEGVRREIEYAHELGKPVLMYMLPRKKS